MASYNRVHGTYASESHRLLDGILRQAWGFDGLVVSDWFATHSTAPALRAGLDLEMPGPSRFRGERLLEAVRAGEAEADDVARAAERRRGPPALVRAAGHRTAHGRAGPRGPGHGGAAAPRRRRRHRAVKNDPARALLPLDPARTRRARARRPLRPGRRGPRRRERRAGRRADRDPRGGPGRARRRPRRRARVLARRTLPALAQDVRLEHLDADGAAVRAEALDRSSVFTDPDAAGLRLHGDAHPRRGRRLDGAA